jgi:hypothetical protein
MTVAKCMPTKRIAAVCVRNRKPYQLSTLQRQAKAAMLLKASKAEEVRSKLEHLEEMLASFEQEVFMGGFQGALQVGQGTGPSEEAMMSDARITDLDNAIESLIGQLHKQIHALRASEEISYAAAYKFKKHLSRLEDRYIDSASFGNEL